METPKSCSSSRQVEFGMGTDPCGLAGQTQEHAKDHPKIKAILIGINDYHTPDEKITRQGIRYPDLRGCVEDVNQVESLLKDLFGTGALEIHRLTSDTATNRGGTPLEESTVEEDKTLPTYANIVDAFKRVTEQAKAKDIVYIHYSGHGAQVASVYGSLKDNNLDEVIVPADILSTGLYLRDVEIAALLDDMVKRELVVTLVLDCCHSGSANRGIEGGAARGIPLRDQVILDRDIIPKEVSKRQTDVWKNHLKLKSSQRGISVKSHWLLEACGYSFLAACSQNESAMEAPLNDGKTQGLLTYNLVATIKNNRSKFKTLTYEQICSLVSIEVKKRNRDQTVVLAGETNRFFLSSDCRETFETARMIRVIGVQVEGAEHEKPAANAELQLATNRSDQTASREPTANKESATHENPTANEGPATDKEHIISMDAGTAKGIREGIEIDVWPSSSIKYESSERIALLEVVYVEGFTLKAKVKEWYKIRQDEQRIEPGFLGRLHNLPQRMVYICPLEEATVGRAEDPTSKLKEELIAKNVPLAEYPKEAFFQVRIHEGQYQIVGNATKRLRSTVSPIPTGAHDAIAKMVRRIIHLTEYYDFLELQNPRTLEAANGADEGCISAHAKECQYNFPGPAKSYLKSGQVPPGSGESCQTSPREKKIVLHIANNSDETRYITVMDLASDWSIEQIFPRGTGPQSFNMEPLSSKQSRRIPMTLTLPDNPSPGEIIDTIKIIATTEGSNYQLFQLPSLQEVDDGKRSGLRKLRPDPIQTFSLETKDLIIRVGDRQEYLGTWAIDIEGNSELLGILDKGKTLQDRGTLGGENVLSTPAN
ncbi:hypothetical protein TWF481_000117 [Arthrobotrys musiformis]|uniref:Peptidase C14 caspase domain-containing protein n=1 Tax=Arthrobotrys musiformis TaxID=47236 RepID=A0AAV9WLV3_9PEZI